MGYIWFTTTQVTLPHFFAELIDPNSAEPSIGVVEPREPSEALILLGQEFDYLNTESLDLLMSLQPKPAAFRWTNCRYTDSRVAFLLYITTQEALNSET
jgi:hypothetical protein